MNCILLAASTAFFVAALTPGWDNINPDRKEFPPQEVLWTASLDAIRADFRDGATGTVRVVTCADGRRKIEISKANDLGSIVVTAPPFAARSGAKLQVYAYCECEDGDPEDGTAFLRLYGKKEDLSYFKGLDKRRPGGPRMKNMVNTAPVTRIRKLAHRIADAKTGTNITAAIVVAGPPSTSLWSDWGIEDFGTSVKAWTRMLDTLVPPDLSSGMQDEDAFERDIAAEREHTAKVERRCGLSRLVIDGDVSPPVIFRGRYGAEGRNTFAGGLHVRNGLDLQAISVRFGEVPGKKRGCWSKNGFDAAAGASIVRGAMRLAPGAKFIVSMNLSAYPGYADEHPDEIWRLKDGRAVFGGSEHIPYSLPTKRAKHQWNWISMHSPSWHRDIKANISAFVSELKRQGLAKRVVGFHFSGLHDGQFATRQPDFSAPARASFRDWQKRKYGSVRWPDPPDSFGEAEFLDPDDPADAHRLAWIRFQKQQPFHVLEDFARHAKACFGKDVIAVRYCMSWGAAAFNGALDVEPFLASDVFDALVAQPSYTHRIPGVAIGTRMPTASFHLNGKLFINEFDLRTYGGTAGREDELFTQGLSKATDFQMWQSIHHKLAGQMIAQRMGWWYCDMSGAWFSPPEIVADIAQVRAQAAEGAAAPVRRWRPSAAVAIDEDGMLLRNSMAHYYALDEYAIQNQLRVLAGSGVPYDTFVLGDLLRRPEAFDPPGPAEGYRIVFFADMHRRDAARRKMLADLAARNVKCVFFDPKKRISPREFAALVREAGGYVPARDGLQVDMNGEFLSVHALKGGHYDFRLPGPMIVRNMKDGSLAADGPTLALDVVAGETCWFRLCPSAQESESRNPERK